MANLNLNLAETSVLVTGFSIAHKIIRGGGDELSGTVYDAINKFALSINIHDRGTTESLLLKLNQLVKDALNEPTNLPSL